MIYIYIYHLGTDTPCRVYRRRYAGRRKRYRCNGHNCVQWCSLCNLCKRQFWSRSCPRVRCTRNAGSAESSRNRARTGRKFCRRCCDDTCSDRSRRRKSCPEHRLRRSRKECNLRDRSHTCLVHNDRNVCLLRTVYRDTFRHSFRRVDCEIPLDYTRRLKFNMAHVCVESYKMRKITSNF